MNTLDLTGHRLCLIDGSGFIYRAYHALPTLSRSDGTPIGAVYGYCNIMARLIQSYQEEYIATVFDAGRESFRNQIWPLYKANRAEVPADLIPQFSLVREACEAFGVPWIARVGFEADDLIASYAIAAAKQGMMVTIVSSDKDLMQLVSDQIQMLDPIKNIVIGASEVQQKFGVLPDRLIDVQALAGDASDNVPGVPGIGLKTAAALVQEFGSLEQILQSTNQIKQERRRNLLVDYSQQAQMSKQLVTLKADLPLDPPLEGFARKEIDYKKLIEFLSKQEFKTLVHKFQQKNTEEGPGGNPRGNREGNSSDSARITAASRSSKRSSSKCSQDIAAATSLGHLEKWCSAHKNDSRIAIALDIAFEHTAPSAGRPSTDHSSNSNTSLPLQPVLDNEANIDPDDEPTHASSAETAFPQISIQGFVLAAEDGILYAPFPAEEALPILNQYLLNSSSIMKIWHDLKLNFRALMNYQPTELLQNTGLADIMVMSYLMNGTQHEHDLSTLGEVYLQNPPLPKLEKKDLPLILEYWQAHMRTIWQLYELWRPQLLQAKLSTLYHRIDLPLASVLAAMEKHGVLVDGEHLTSLSAQFGQEIELISQTIYQMAGAEFNIGSPKQLSEVLFQKLSLPTEKKSKTGIYSTSADILENLSLAGHVIAEKILEWRQLSKLKSTYTDSLVQEIDPKTRRVHTVFSATSTATGRLSSSAPNLQNIPIKTALGRKIRQAFKAPEGKVLVSCDYSQIELRILAHIAQVKKLIQAFNTKEADIHKTTASEIFGIPIDQVNSDMRRNAKAINFGIIYGLSAFGLSRYLNITTEEANRFIQLYFERYPEILAYMEKTKEFARKHGHVKTLWGRKCFISGINDKNATLRHFAERQAINAPIQGTQADLIKKAMVKMPDTLLEAGYQAPMILQVHDELIFECDVNDYKDCQKLIRKTMSNVMQLNVPIVVDSRVYTRWGEENEEKM